MTAKDWDKFEADLKASTSKLPDPPSPYSKNNTAATFDTVRLPKTSNLTNVVKPADTTSAYKTAKATQTEYLNNKATYAYDNVSPKFNDNYRTPSTLPENTNSYKQLTDKAFLNNETNNPFNTFNSTQAQKTLGCLGQNFLPTLPSFQSLGNPLQSLGSPLNSIFGFSPFDIGLKSQSVLQKSGGFLGPNIASILLGTATKFLGNLLSPVSNTLKTVSNCFKQD